MDYPHGRLSRVTPAADTNTLLYQDPKRSGAFRVNISVSNRNASDVKIRLAIVDGLVADLVVTDWFEYDVTVRVGGLITRTGVIIGPGQSLICYADKVDVNFQAGM